MPNAALPRCSRSCGLFPAIVALAGAASACFDDSVPDDAELLCVDESDCPSEMRCEPFRHVCVTRGDDSTPPEVSATFLPSSSRGGETITLRLSSDEALSDEPAELVFAPGVPEAQWAFDPTSDGAVQQFTLALPADAPEGTTRLLQVAIADAAGNGALVDVVASFTVDRTAPRIDGVQLDDGTDDGVLRLSDRPGSNVLTTRVLLSEQPAPDALVVRMGGARASSCTEGTALVFTCLLSIDPVLIGNGDNALDVEVEDAAGNRTTNTLTVHVDTEAPQVVAGSAVLRVDGSVGTIADDLSEARVGSVVQVSATLDEPCTGLPVVSLGVGGVAFHVTSAADGALLVAQRVVDAEIAPGTHEVVAVVTDAFGHAATRVLGELVVVDSNVSPCPPAPLDAGGSGCSDADGDGQPGASPTCPAAVSVDCDDANPAVFAGAPESPGDHVGNDCDGAGIDMPIDEDSGVFFDPTAVPPGDGSRAAPFTDLQVASDAAGAAFVYLASGAGTFTANTISASLVGGLEPAAGWQRVATARTSVSCPTCPFADGLPQVILSGRVHENLELDQMEVDFVGGGSLTRAITVVGGVDLGGARRAIGVEADIVRSYADAGLRFIGGTAGALEVITGYEIDVVRSHVGFTTVRSAGRLRAVSSTLGGLLCAACVLAEVSFSTVLGSEPDALRHVTGADTSVVRVSASYLASAPGSFATALQFEANLQYAFTDVRYLSIPNATWVDSTTTIAIAADGTQDELFNQCLVDACTAAADNAVVFADPLMADGVHLRPDAASLIDRAHSPFTIPDAAVADIDGECRFDASLHGVPDIGADER